MPGRLATYLDHSEVSPFNLAVVECHVHGRRLHPRVQPPGPGEETMPSCCIIPSVSTTPQCSTIFPLE
jgi:hypothetical protein